MIDEKLNELAKELVKSYNELYNIYVKEVDRIINNNINDTDLIEHTLDGILDIYTEKGFYLFLKLLFYYSTINLEKSYTYFDILEDERREEYDEYIKKLAKINRYPQ